MTFGTYCYMSTDENNLSCGLYKMHWGLSMLAIEENVVAIEENLVTTLTIYVGSFQLLQ